MCSILPKQPSIASHFYLNTWAERRPPQRWACTAPHLGRTGHWQAGQRAARSQTRLWGTLDAGSSPGRCRRTAAWRRSSRDTAGSRAAASSSCAWSSETSPPVDSWSSLQLGHLRGRYKTCYAVNKFRDMKPFSLPLWGEQSWRGHPLGQSNGAVVTVVQLFHDEAEVRQQEGRRRESPNQRGGVHQHGHQQQDVREKLQGANGPL